MDDRAKRWFKIASGKDWESAVRTPRAKEVVERRIQELGSRRPLRALGWASDGETLLSEEARESHIHIIGAPGEGKSKAIEMLVEQDIKQGYGACVLDQSRHGATVYKILKHCIKIGFEKVVLIDPHDIFTFGRVPCLNPFQYYVDGSGELKPDGNSVRNIVDTIRVLWGSKPEDTAKINKYLPAILHTLHANRMTLYESIYFNNQTHPVYTRMVADMLDNMPPLDDNRIALQTVLLSTRTQFNTEMDSTSRRLNPLLEKRMRLMLASNGKSVPFAKLIAEKWLVLVNLDRALLWTEEQQRLLGTLVLHGLIDASDRLVNSGWKSRFYVYVDEFGQYATRNVANYLAYQRKSGLIFTVGHQYFGQIEDKYVADAVEHATKIKILFQTPGREDRDRMVRMMYGGDIPDRQVSYELGQLGKQYATIKINKQPPRITHFHNVPDVHIEPDVLKDFKTRLYAQEWFSSPEQVLNEINARLKKTESRLARQPTPPRASSDSQPKRNTKRAVEKPSGVKGKRKDSGSVRPPAVPDDSAGGSPVLFKKTGRATRKVPKIQPPES